MDEGVDEEPLIVSATSVGWGSMSSSGVKYSDGESEEKVVCRLFEPEKVIRGSSSESASSVVSAPRVTWPMKRLSP